ncbi:MAG: hypothetical protein ACP5GX_12715, partial [Anaerolineae bacterium]
MKQEPQISLRAQRYDFEDFAYIASVDILLEIAKGMAGGRGNKGKDVLSDIDQLLGKKGVPQEWNDVETVAEQLALNLEQPDAFMDHWDRARYYLMYADHIMGRLDPESPIERLLDAFPMPQDAAETLRQVADAWRLGGFGKYVVPMAYHFLKGPTFADRQAEALPPEKVLDKLHQRTVDEMKKLDTRAGRQAVVAELGFRHDLTVYLNEHLYLSSAPETHLEDDAFEGYSKPKLKSHAKGLCSVCNRNSANLREVRTQILEDESQIFTNRSLPLKRINGNRYWCPVCYLEFTLRKLVGLGLPGSGGYVKSRRIYLYVLPTFSFTPEHVRLFQPLLSQFQHVTNLPVRDYGKDAPGAPR